MGQTIVFCGLPPSPAETSATGVLAEKQVKPDGVMARLREAQIKTDECFRETERRFRETDLRFSRADERSRNLDERIDDLVREIRAFVRNKPL